MKLSVVIVTHNRRATLLATLDRLAAPPLLPRGGVEVLVVDNGSTDGTAQAVESLKPREGGFSVRVLRRNRNEGVSARNHAFAVARGEFVLLIDDDSYPLGDAVARSVRRMEGRADVGAVVGRVELPDGTLEASALPSVMINCAVCLRRRVLEEVGGFPTEFFRQAEEYDLSFRVWQAGYRIERFEDLVYRHEKAGGNRWPGWVHCMDLRNNLILVERYLPASLRRDYRADWTQRYTALAAHAGHATAARRAGLEGLAWRLREAITGRRTVSGGVIEAVFGLEAQARAVASWAGRLGIRRVAIADFSKNIYATWHACQEARLAVQLIADNNPAFKGSAYRGVNILPDSSLAAAGDTGLQGVDGVVLSNVNPAQVERRAGQLRAVLGPAGVPVLQLWQPQMIDSADVFPAALREPSCAA